MKKIFVILITILLSTGANEVYSLDLNLFNSNSIEKLDTDVRRGRSFGGRRSFGRSRSSSKRSTRSNTRSRTRQTLPKSKKAPSFGGKRMTKTQAKQRYGTPRKTEKISARNSQGLSQPYVVNHYGGYSSGLMMGYMMGHSMWYWSMPFHPAYYYSRPTYVENADGTVEVYPPTFSWGRVFFTLILVGAVIFVIRKIFFSKNTSSYSSGSFG